MVETGCELVKKVAQKFPNAIFFGGQMVFARESWLTRLLHNFVVFTLQRRLLQEGLTFQIVPIFLELPKAAQLRACVR